jgi:hypothetical protein
VNRRFARVTIAVMLGGALASTGAAAQTFPGTQIPRPLPRVSGCPPALDQNGEMLLAAGVVTIADVDVFRVGPLIVRLKKDSDVYFDVLRLSREEVNVKAYARVPKPGQKVPDDVVFDHTAVLDLDVPDTAGFRMGGLFGMGDLAFTLFRDRCAYEQVRLWGGQRVTMFFRFNRGPS